MYEELGKIFTGLIVSAVILLIIQLLRFCLNQAENYGEVECVITNLIIYAIVLVIVALSFYI